MVISLPKRPRRGRKNSNDLTRPRVEAGTKIITITALRLHNTGAVHTPAARATNMEGVAYTHTQTSSGTKIKEKKNSKRGKKRTTSKEKKN